MARIVHGVLEPEEVQAVQVSPAGAVEVVVVADPAAIYFRVDGEDPEIGGDDCEVVVGAIGAAFAVDVGDDFTEVRMISEGAPAFCVRGM